MFSGRRVVAMVSLVAIFVLAGGGRAFAQATGTVSGVVSIPNGSQLVNATVTLEGQGKHVTVKSDVNGAFSIVGLSPGLYIVRVSAPGYKPVNSASLSVTATWSIALNIVLQPQDNSSIAVIGHVTQRGTNSLGTSTPSTIVVTANDFLQAGDSTIAQALGKLPGVTVQTSEASGGGPNDENFVAIHGAYGASENLVLIDGDPVHSFFGAAVVDGFTPATFQRVETLEGLGATSLFGAAAIGGTVNFVTRDPLRSPGAEFTYTWDSFNSSDFNVLASSTTGKVGYLVDYQHRYTPGPVPANYLVDDLPGQIAFNGASPPATFSAATGYILNLGYGDDVTSSLLKAKYDFSPFTSLTLSSLLSEDARQNAQGSTFFAPVTIGSVAHANDPMGVPYVQSGGPIGLDDLHSKYAAQFHTLLFGGDVVFHAYREHYYGLSFVDGQPLPVNSFAFAETSRADLGGMLLSYSHPIGDTILTFSTGANTEHDQGFFQAASGNSLAGVPLSPISSSTQLERTYALRADSTLGSNLTATLSAFYSTYDTLNVHRFDPRLAFTYRPDRSSVVRVSAGTGFAPPPLADLTLPLQSSAASAFFVPQLCPTPTPCVAESGNVGLKPETAAGFDLGYERTFGERGRVGISYYDTQLSNHQDFGFVAAPAGLLFSDGTPILWLLQPVNIQRFAFAGGSIYGTLPLTRELSLGGTFSVQSAYPIAVDPHLQLENAQYVARQQSQGIPLHQPSASLNYENRHGGISADFGWQFVDNNNQYALPAFSVYDADVAFATKLGTIHVNGKNIFTKTRYFGLPFGTGVPYEGANGPIATGAGQPPFKSVGVTLDVRVGSLKRP